ncbi:PulJ/GspJ family protein [Bacillus sp. EB01]|uniref:PulJ/GspJ family protein n=1 Tax=Bacillus sp. EB01 TaxID=1347086 RepID=UPI0005C508E4|nr:prepilin-type N-terminal cleavage/methylation domain-containing protein [Bacillus sp. EB01]
MNKNSLNQEGFTLLEVLLSIVLLTIIMTSFLGFFTQSAIFNKKNEQKLDTMQTAQRIVNMIEINIEKQDLIVLNLIDANGIVLNKPKSLTKLELEQYLGEPIASDYTISALMDNSSFTINSTTENLIMFKVIVQNPADSNDKSETYTYIRR